MVAQGKSRNGEVFTEIQFLRQDQEVYPTFGALSDVNGTVGFSPDALERVARIEPRMNGLLLDCIFSFKKLIVTFGAPVTVSRVSTCQLALLLVEVPGPA